MKAQEKRSAHHQLHGGAGNKFDPGQFEVADLYKTKCVTWQNAWQVEWRWRKKLKSGILRRKAYAACG